MGKPLNYDTVKLVKALYCQDDISRIMPGAKDYVSVREGSQRVHKQRRLLLLNLNELKKDILKQKLASVNYVS